MTEPRATLTFARIAGAFAIVVGICALFGWIAGIPVFTSLFPGLPTMKPNTAVALAMLGCSVVLSGVEAAGPISFSLQRGCSAVALALGAATLAEYLLGIQWPIDQLIWPVNEPGTRFPGRMAPNTALITALLGSALLLLDSRRTLLRSASQGLSIAALFLGFVASVGYLYEVKALYGVPGYTSMALHTSICFAVLGAGALCARPQRGVIGILGQDNPAGATVRRMLPTVTIAILLLGWLRLKGEHAGLYGSEFGLALMASASIAVITGVQLWNAVVQGRAENSRQEAVRLIDAVNDCAIVLLDSDGNLSTWNRGAERLLQYPAAEMIGRSFRVLYGERGADNHEVEEDLRIAESSGRYEYEKWLVRSDGTRFLAEIVVSAMRNSRGHVQGFAKVIRDITERSQAAEQLRMALEAAPTGMLMSDAEGKIVLVNGQIETLFGFARNELLGKSLDLLIPERFRERHQGLRAAYFADRSSGPMVTGRTIHGLRKDGNEVPIEILLNPLRTPRGNFVLSAITDLTERLRASETHQRMASLVESATDAILTKTLDGIVRSWNPAAERLLGYSAAEMIGQSVVRLIPDDRLDEENQIIRQIKQGRPVTHFETVRRTKSGTLIEVSLMISPILSANGEIVGASKIMRDITEQKAVAAQLRRSHERFAIASEAAGIGFWDYDLGSNLLHWDDQMFKLYGCARSESQQPYELWAEHVHPEDLARSEAELQDAIRGVRAFDTEFRIVHPSGDVRNVRGMARVIRDESGTATQLFGVNFDVTDRRHMIDKLAAVNQQLDSALRASKSFLARVGTVAGVGGWELDLRSNTLIWSDETNRLHDADPDFRPTLEDALAFIAPGSRAAVEHALREAIDFVKPYDLELEMVSAKGRHFWARATATAELEDGKVVRLVGAFQDISQRRIFEQQLRQSIETAQDANNAKSEFLANMSHEIRTPLNAVIGLGYLLDQTRLELDQRELVKKIQFAGRSLLGVVNNVLDLSKIEAGEMLLEESTFDLPELLNDTLHMLAPQAAGKGVVLSLKCEENLPSSLLGDMTRLRQVLTNLVNNAIKFTERGTIDVEVRCAEQSVDRIRLHCAVTDTGIGIDPQSLERLFSPFTQADASTTRRFGGTGLGLTIARKFVELMSGEIGVTSQLQLGSTFWFEIPLRVVQAVDGSVRTSAGGVRILVADATSDSRTALDAMIRSLGWQSNTVESSDRLLQVVRDNPPSAWPDVLMLKLPSPATGFRDLMASLGQQSARGTIPPIISLLDDAETYVECSSLIRSSDSILVGKINCSTLFNAVNTAVWSHRDSRDRLLKNTAFNEVKARWLAGVRVLVADDSEINLMVARGILEEQGATVSTCSDGAEAVATVRKNLSNLDVVLMDVQMPVMDGNEATRQIRSDAVLADLPIVALTAGALVNERQRSLDAGMNDFLSKPFDPVVLIRKIRNLVERTRGTPLPIDVVETKIAATGALKIDMPSIDAGVVRRLFGEQHSLFESLLTRLLREYSEFAVPTVLPDEAGGRANLQARMHKLQGSAGMLGATEISRLAREIEGKLRADPSDVKVDTLLERLAAALTQLRLEAASWLNSESAVSGPDGWARAAVDASAADIERLFRLLDHQDLAAIDVFHGLSGSLRNLLADADAERIFAAMDDLDFKTAADTLRASLPVGSASKAGYSFA